MNESAQFDNRELLAEASAWVAQIESGDMSPADLAALREWMGRSPRHAQELREMAQLSGQLAVLTDMAEPLAVAAAANNPWRRRGRRIANMGFPALATAALVLVVATVAIFRQSLQTDIHQQTYRTARGELQTHQLPDGSVIEMNALTELEVRYERDERRVVLTRGEAVFDVEKNSARPFRVYAGTSVAEAVGTSFVVKRRNNRTELSVIEGVVGFAQTTRGKAAPAVDNLVTDDQTPSTTEMLLVHENEVVAQADIETTSADKPQLAQSLSPREIRRRTSWTEGLYDFADTPLVEVIAEIALHDDTQIEIADEALHQLRFGGMFRIGDTETLLDALAELGVSVERLNNNRVILKANTTSQG